MSGAAMMKLLAFGAALALTLVLAAWLTPARWWRRPTARGALVLAAGCWAIGKLLLSFAPALPRETQAAGAAPLRADSGSAMAAMTRAEPVRLRSDGVPGQATTRFRVADDLNLRAAGATSAARVAVVPAGAYVTASGARDGDWWELRATVDGKPVRGWASSLWLRRPDERR